MKERFKEIRKIKKLSLKQVGDVLGISESSVSNIERGRNNPSGSTLTLFCEKFGVNRHWLETGEGDMFLPKPESALPAELTDDPMIRAILEAYLDLDPESRQLFRKFFADAAARYKAIHAHEPKPAPGIRIRMPLIQGTDEAELQMRYQSKQEQRELEQTENLTSDPT